MASRAKRTIAHLKHRWLRWSRRYLLSPIVLTSHGGRLKNIASKAAKGVRFSAWAIVGGLCAEIIVLLIFSAGKSWIETTLLIVCTFVVAGGVFGEDHFAHIAGDIASELQSRADLQIAEANARGAEANAKALEAQLALETFKAPRMLSPEQRARISEKLKQFAGQTFSGSVSIGAGDGRTLWAQIAGALQAANWERVQPPGLATGEPPAGVPLVIRPGVRILFAAQRFDLQPKAEALAAAISAEGIDAIGRPAHGTAVEANPEAIRIEIGPKT